MDYPIELAISTQLTPDGVLQREPEMILTARDNPKSRHEEVLVK